MPRRPCAVTLSPDGSTVFCADKFGDVYTLPLLPSPEQDQSARDAAKPITKPFTITASELTVHSKANLKSLKNQMKQVKEGSAMSKIKEPLAFAHDLILGHVSMLTAVVIAESHHNGRKQFVVTADRDEHIRISRSPPQAFVIERFCLGHKEFISKLCLVGDDILISGGGDDDLYVWNWQRGEQLRTINLRASFSEALEANAIGVGGISNIAVTGLWSLSSLSTSIVSLLTID
jgi:tRNA (guanine-N(7)-)-methyltransferase subunit TRM82